MLQYKVRAVGFAQEDRRRLCSQGGTRGSKKGKITGEQGQQGLAVSAALHFQQRFEEKKTSSMLGFTNIKKLNSLMLPDGRRERGRNGQRDREDA